MIAPAHMPFLRAGKGTVQRQSTLALFESSIDCLYREDDEVVISSGVDGGPESLAIEDVVAGEPTRQLKVRRELTHVGFLLRRHGLATSDPIVSRIKDRVSKCTHNDEDHLL